MEENLFQTLLRGSRNIDRMRKEINETVSMFMGFLTEDNYLLSLYKNVSSVETIIIEEENIRWVLFFTKIPGCYYLYVNLYFSGTSISYRYTDRTPKEIPLKDVLSVYETLPGFVDQMIRKFPKLSSKMEFLIQVSDKF